MNDHWQPEERLFLHREHSHDAGGTGRRYFSRGGVKFALLALLETENMHGYQMMKALEEQSDGTYKPSAGSIYPTLQMLRDQDYVDVYKQDGKRVFRLTDAGKAYLHQSIREEKLEERREVARDERIENGDERIVNRDKPIGNRDERIEGEGRRERTEGRREAEGGGSSARPLHCCDAADEEREDRRRRGRRLTPAGKELLHLLKRAERAAIDDSDKAAQLRGLLTGFRDSLRRIAGAGDGELRPGESERTEGAEDER